MRSSLLLAVVPLAAALPRGQHAVGVVDKLKRLVNTQVEGMKVYSENIPKKYHELVKTWRISQPLEVTDGDFNEFEVTDGNFNDLEVTGGNFNDLEVTGGNFIDLENGNGDTIITTTTTIIEYPSGAKPTPASEPAMVNWPAAPVQVTPPKATAVQPPKQEASQAGAPSAAKDDKKSDSAQSSNSTSYQTETLKWHNEARQKVQGDPRQQATQTTYALVELSWSAELEALSLEWAKGCAFKHSENWLKVPGTVAENIAAQPIVMAGDELAASKESWKSWYTKELPAFGFNFKSTDLATGHVSNILNPAFDKVGQASYLCPQFHTQDDEGNPTVEKNWYFTVSRFSGPPA